MKVKEVSGESRKKSRCIGPIGQQSPTFLAPGTGFVEDNFSTDGGGDGSGGNASDEERQMKFPSLTCSAAHLLLCSLVSNRLWTGTGPQPGGWGPLK